jgi:hypothetical protein
VNVDIELLRLHTAQQTIIDSPARFKVLICGRRFGKTAVCIDTIVNHLLNGRSCAYFAPTFRMASEAWREVKRIMLPLISDGAENEWRLEMYTGGLFECWSLMSSTAETVRGRKYHYVVIDEAALIPSSDLWHSAIRPLLTDYQGGALFASTPRGRNWLWELYLQGQNPEYAEWESWRYATGANPYIRAEEIEAAKQGMPERFFRQEYEAEFLDDGGVVFRNIQNVCMGEAEAAWQSGQSYVFGVDWGKDKDFTCVSVMTKEGRQVYLERFNQIGWEIQRGRLAHLHDRFKPYVILAEANSIGSVNIEALRNEGLPIQGFMTTAKSKAPLIETLALAMERDEVTLLHDPVLIHELMTYGVTRTGYHWQYSAPSGGHDDTVMATALSYWASQRYGRVLIDFV